MHRSLRLCAAGFLLVGSVVASGFLPTVASANVGSRTAAAGGAGQAVSKSKSVWSGVYTETQSKAGEKIYFARCSSCHGDDLEGREQAPPLAGPTFLDGWHGRDLRRLLDRILTMPPGDPVSPEQAVDLVAFLLRTAEMPAGSTALPGDRGALTEIMFERAKP